MIMRLQNRICVQIEKQLTTPIAMFPTFATSHEYLLHIWA